MAQFVLLGLVTVACVRGLVQWRDGLFGVVLIAAVQDPLRKLVPGAPSYLALAAAPVMIVALIGLVGAKRSWWSGFARRFPQIRRALGWFLLACVPAAIISAFYGPGSWLLTILGAFSYGVMLMAILIGFHFARSGRDIRRFLGFYCLVTVVMLSGAVIQYFDLWPGSPMVGTAALGHTWIRHIPGAQIEMMSGFYRSPDVMGWHAAATAMFASILAMTQRKRSRWGWFAVAAVASVALMLCGRRKMVFMLPTFVAVVTWMYWQARVSKGRLTFVVGLLAVALIGVAGSGTELESGADLFRYYTENPGDVLDRVETHGFRALVTTYEQTGFFGTGLGVAAPGSQNLNVARPRVWQEGAGSRIMVELGVPGTVALIFLVGALLAAGWRATLRGLRTRSSDSAYAVGLFGFFVANGASLVVSGQILANPAVGMLVGLSIGIVLSVGRSSAVPVRTGVVARVPSERWASPAAPVYSGLSRFPAPYTNTGNGIQGGVTRH